ncbi:MAG: helix-turn-helix domain-containing protein [Monoglobales bacterium]
MIRLRELREEKHINQQKLAIALNVTQAAISKYELGLSEPDISMLKNIADYFHVSVDYLIGFSDSPISCKRSDIPEDELKLINNYRRLTSIQKEKLKAYMQGLMQE